MRAVVNDNTRTTPRCSRQPQPHRQGRQVNSDHTDYPPIRSYVRREGRITPAQRRALVELWPMYGIEFSDNKLVFERVFGRDLPTILEIGFGDGGALAGMAADNPQCNFLGVEVYRPGVGSLLRQLEQNGITNVRVIAHDAAPVLRDMIEKDSLAKLLLFFPDPWPKKRHHKRRLLQAAFLHTAIERLEPGGHIHVATDWKDYALHTLALFSNEPRLRNTAEGKGFAARPAYRPQTKYERRGITRGHEVWDIVFQRVA